MALHEPSLPEKAAPSPAPQLSLQSLHGHAAPGEAIPKLFCQIHFALNIVQINLPEKQMSIEWGIY